MTADSPVTGIDDLRRRTSRDLREPEGHRLDQGARKPKNKKSSTSITFSSDNRCAGIKSFSVLYPKGTKVNKKQMIYNKKKKATKKNLKNIIGKFGSKRMQATDFQAVGSNGLKLKGNLPDGVNVVTMATKNSTVLLPVQDASAATSRRPARPRPSTRSARRRTSSSPSSSPATTARPSASTTRSRLATSA